MRTPERTVLAIAVAVILIVVASASLTIAFGSPDIAVFPPDGPEGVLQRYLVAAQSNDVTTMDNLLSERVREERDKNDFSPGFCSRVEDRIVSVDRVSINGDNAVVVMNIEQFNASLFGSSSNQWQQEVRLVQESGGWKLDESFFCV